MNTTNKMVVAIFGIVSLLAAEASTLEFEFGSAIRNSSDVVLVQIVSGQSLGDVSDGCGASYYAKALRRYKGKHAQYLEFGSLDALKIGDKYLVFVDPRDSYIKNRTGWLNFRMRAYEESHRARVTNLWQKCQKLLPEMMVSIELGTFAVEHPSELGYQTEAVKIPSLSIRLPKGTVCFEATSVDELDKGLDAVWIKLPEIERIIFESMQNSTPKDDGRFIESRDCQHASS